MIGIFDSGIGGLSVLAAIAHALPQADLVYLADTAHLPYGEKDDAFIRRRVLMIGRHLVDQGCTVVVACNTATAAAVAAFREACPGWATMVESLQLDGPAFADEAPVEAATPHWQRVESKRNAAIALDKPIRELEQAVQAAANGQKAQLQGHLKALKSEQSVHEQAAKSAQAEGDALYWPIYNLDLKNPHAKAGLEYADPKDLIARMRGHEAEVMRLLSEIETLVNEVEQ